MRRTGIEPPRWYLWARMSFIYSLDPSGAFGAMLFADPESSEGLWLRTLLTENITIVPDARVTSSVSELRTFAEQPFAGLEVGALIRHCVQALSPGPLPMRPTRLIGHRSGDGFSLPPAVSPICFKQQVGRWVFPVAAICCGAS